MNKNTLQVLLMNATKKEQKRASLKAVTEQENMPIISVV